MESHRRRKVNVMLVAKKMNDFVQTVLSVDRKGTNQETVRE
jgi:hypothetical protein